MVMTRRMTAKQNQEASSRKRLKTSDSNGDSASWSNMFHDILFLIILRLGVIDFIAFSGVCKSWRTVALSNRSMFMLSRQPMHISISPRVAKKKRCYLEDLEGRKFVTILPHSSFRKCIGSICGYLILFGRRARDIWLVNPITRHELHFPRFPFYVGPDPESFRCALVYSPTMCSWAFVVSIRFSSRLSFAFSNKRTSWTHIGSNFPICDLHFFQGKVYALSIGLSLLEVRVGPNPILTQLKMKTLVRSELMFPEFATLGGKLHVIGNRSKDQFGSVEVDFDQMTWLNPAKALKEYAWFASSMKCGFTKLVFWTAPSEQYEKFGYFHGTDERDDERVAYSAMWYSPHKCLDVNLLHE